jgi:ribosomal protein L4
VELEQASVRLQHALVELVFLRTHATHGTHTHARRGIQSSAGGRVTGRHEARRARWATFPRYWPTEALSRPGVLRR